MSPTLVVETADLVGAAQSLSSVGERLWSSVGGAVGDAMSSTGMAGDDPAGLRWADRYSASATQAVAAAQDVINGAFALSTLLVATARNYASADAASTPGDRHAVDDAVGRAPDAETITLAARFDDVGGAAFDPPFAWSLVQRIERFVWPNGHQDRLLHAAAAWRRSAAALDARATDVELACLTALVDDLPEWHDIHTACFALAGHLRDVAAAHTALGQACADYAHHLDVVHSQLEHDLDTFMLQSAGIEILGNGLAAFTAGISDAVAQGAEGTRIGASIARIAADLGEFAEAVQAAIVALPVVSELSARVQAGMRELLSVRVVVADVVGAPGLRMLAVARDGRVSGEVGAVTRLADDADLPAALRAASDSPRLGGWRDQRLLHVHFNNHASDFGITSESEYARRAAEFFRTAVRDHYLVKVDPVSGDIRIFDPATNTFGSYAADGTVRTFFKPTSRTYWTRQIGAETTW